MGIFFNRIKKGKNTRGRILTEDERINYLRSLHVDNRVRDYLNNLLDNLNIDIMSLCKGKILTLMSQEKLIGWCWQTAETACIFFDGENDFVERGYLFLDPRREDYFHSWISFRYNDGIYVFDPCLNILCKSEDYYRTFCARIVSSIPASTIRGELINKIRESHGNDSRVPCNDNFEYLIDGTNDINDAFFRGKRGYIPDLTEDNKNLLLTAHFYPDEKK